MRLRRLGVLCVASAFMATLLPANAFAAFRLGAEGAAGIGFVMTDQPFDGANGDLGRSLGRILVGDHDLLPGITSADTVAETEAAVPSAHTGIYSQLFLSSIAVTTTRAATVSLFIEDQVPGYGLEDASTALPAIAEPPPTAGTTPTPLHTFASNGKEFEIFGGESYTWFSDVGPAPGYPLGSASAIDSLGAGPVDLKRNIFAAPEPSALALFGAGLLGIVHVARRRRRALTRHDA
jgi:hypothetical protein